MSELKWKAVLPRLMARWQGSGERRQHFIVGAFWSVLGAGLGQGLGLVANAVAARILGPERFGEIGAIYSTVGMFGVFAGLGMGITGTRFLAEYRDSEPQRCGRIAGLAYLVTLFFGLIISALVFVLAPLLARTALAAPHLSQGLRLGSMLLLLTSVDGAQTGQLAGLEAFSSVAVSRIVHGVTLLLALPMGATRGGVSGGIAGMTIAAGLSCVVNFVSLRKQYTRYGISIRLPRLEHETKVLFEFSIPAALSGLLVSPVIWLSNALVVNQDEGYMALGLFQAAVQWQRAIMFLPSALSSVLLALLSRPMARSSERFARFNVLSSWLIGLGLALPLMVFPELIWWIYGERYPYAIFGPTLSLVMLYTIVVAYKDGLARVLATESLMWWGVASNIVWGFFLVGFTIILRSFGAPGLALAYVLAYGLNTIVFVPFYVRRGLAPPSVLISRRVLGAWALLITAGILATAGASLALRVLLLVPLGAALSLLVAGMVGFARRLPMNRSDSEVFDG